jgi:hypothetical protein
MTKSLSFFEVIHPKDAKGRFLFPPKQSFFQKICFFMQNTIQQPSQKVHKSWQKLSLQELKIHISENKKT